MEESSGSPEPVASARAPGAAFDRLDGALHHFEVGAGQRVSALAWGVGEPVVVFLHGRGQNAHTWTAVVEAMQIPAIAIDLPGHGHSDWCEDHDYGAWPNADAVARVIAEAAPLAAAVVGMSLGGTTTIRLAAKYPHLVRRAVVVDASPASRDGRPPLTAEQRGATALLEGPWVFDSFDDMVSAAAATVPGRSLDSLRAGVERNSRQRDDGRWMWRYDPQRPEHGPTPQDRSLLWEDLSAINVPIMLVCAGQSGRVREADVEEFVRRQPSTRVEVVERSGHSVQSDQPRVLAELIASFLAEDLRPQPARPVR